MRTTKSSRRFFGARWRRAVVARPQVVPPPRLPSLLPRPRRRCSLDLLPVSSSAPPPRLTLVIIIAPWRALGSLGQSCHRPISMRVARRAPCSAPGRGIAGAKGATNPRHGRRKEQEPAELRERVEVVPVDQQPALAELAPRFRAGFWLRPQSSCDLTRSLAAPRTCTAPAPTDTPSPSMKFGGCIARRRRQTLPAPTVEMRLEAALVESESRRSPHTRTFATAFC